MFQVVIGCLVEYVMLTGVVVVSTDVGLDVVDVIRVDELVGDSSPIPTQ
jgi:hypothetical protein